MQLGQLSKVLRASTDVRSAVGPFATLVTGRAEVEDLEGVIYNEKFNNFLDRYNSWDKVVNEILKYLS